MDTDPLIATDAPRSGPAPAPSRAGAAAWAFTASLGGSLIAAAALALLLGGASARAPLGYFGALALMALLALLLSAACGAAFAFGLRARLRKADSARASLGRSLLCGLACALALLPLRALLDALPLPLSDDFATLLLLPVLAFVLSRAALASAR